MSELLRRTLGETIQIETVLSGGLWRVFADPAQLESALLNLVVNARDAMAGSGGKLTIETANAHLDERYARAHAEVDCRPVCDDRGDRHRHGHDARGDGARPSIPSSRPRRRARARASASARS